MGNMKRDKNGLSHKTVTEERVLRFNKLWHAMAYLIILTIIILSLIPHPEEITHLTFSDKIQHVLAYAVAMFWFGLCFRRDRLYIIGIILFIMGVIIEIIQGQTGYRTMSFYDVVANVTGVLIGLLLSFSRLSLALQYIEKLFFK
jgi:VanZ family protein